MTIHEPMTLPFTELRKARLEAEALRNVALDLTAENEALWAGLQAAFDKLAEAHAEIERLTTPVMISLDFDVVQGTPNVSKFIPQDEW